ncbi:MAG: DUF481 domain-containing protein, partial [Candidatus Krumholzibacteriota bacterium]
ITCEIKEMVRGKVRAKTDHMGTIFIEWDKVTRVASNYWFLVSLRNGSLIYGQISPGTEDGYLMVIFQDRTTSVPMSEVVEIAPVRFDVRDRFNLSVSFGFNWSKGSDVLQSHFDAGAHYKGKIYSYGLSLNGMITEQGEGEITRRNQADLWLEREINGRLHGMIESGSYRNDELGVRMRVSGGANLGYYVFRGSHLELRTLAGGGINREWATADADPANNTEGRIGADLNLFYYDTPKSDVSVQVDFFPSFTVSDRYRFEGSISARQEIIKDLFIKLEYYESRDSKPLAGASSSNDRGIVFSIEWSD